MREEWMKASASNSGANCLQARWIKSSYSHENGNCVEALLGDKVQVRDSKNPGGEMLSFTPQSWTSFLDGIRAGDYTA